MSQKPPDARRKGSSAWSIQGGRGGGGGQGAKKIYRDKEKKYITSPKTESNPGSNACRRQRMPYGHEILHSLWLNVFSLTHWPLESGASRHYLVERRNCPERFFESGTRLAFVADGKSYLPKFGHAVLLITILLLGNCAHQAAIRGSTAHKSHLLDYKTDKLIYGPGYAWVFGPRFERNKGKRALIYAAL